MNITPSKPTVHVCSARFFYLPCPLYLPCERWGCIGCSRPAPCWLRSSPHTIWRQRPSGTRRPRLPWRPPHCLPWYQQDKPATAWWPSPVISQCYWPGSWWQCRWSRRCPWSSGLGVCPPWQELLSARRPTDYILISLYHSFLSPPWWHTDGTGSSRAEPRSRISGTSSNICTPWSSHSGPCRRPGWGWTAWRPAGCSDPPCTGGCQWSSWSRSSGGSRTPECPRLKENKVMKEWRRRLTGYHTSDWLTRQGRPPYLTVGILGSVFQSAGSLTRTRSLARVSCLNVGKF